MNNQNFEFKSYIQTPNDQYMLGVAKVKIYGKVIACYKHVKTKDGTSTFFCPQNYTLTDAMGEKKYIPCVQLDSRDEEEELYEFIRSNVHRVLSQKPALQAQQSVHQAQYYPHGMVQNAQPQANQMPSTSEVAANEQLPF